MKVMVFGTFDILHPGHIFFLKKARKYGDLTVVVGRDLNVKKIKGRFPHNREMLRVEKLRRLDIAEKVILGNISDPYKVIEDENPDIICLGYDQDSYTDGLKKELRNRGLLPDIIRINSHMPDKFKSSKYRK